MGAIRRAEDAVRPGLIKLNKYSAASSDRSFINNWFEFYLEVKNGQNEYWKICLLGRHCYSCISRHFRRYTKLRTYQRYISRIRTNRRLHECGQTREA